MFTINLTRQGHTPDEVAMVDRYLKAHCPVAHGFKIGGMCESAESLARVAFALRLMLACCTDGPKLLATAGESRKVHLRQLHERHAVVWPEDTNQPLARL